MRRVALALVLLFAVGGWFAFEWRPEHRAPRAGEVPSNLAPLASVDSEVHEASAPDSRPGFPSMEGAVERRSWQAMVDRELGATAALAAGDEWTPANRERLMTALARLRDASRLREQVRDSPESEEGVHAARRHREAALAADAVSHELFGIPLAALVQRAQPGAVEEVVPAG